MVSEAERRGSAGKCFGFYLVLSELFFRLLKGRVWLNIIFCVWLAFAMKKVVAITAELNLAWFRRYEPQKPDSDDVTAFSLTRQRARPIIIQWHSIPNKF